ncbi:MAG: ATP-binding protein [Phycisphaerae bacterium]
MPLAEVKYQSHAQKLLQRAITGQRLPHAYIFHGLEGIGKEMLARGLAQLLLCARPLERSLEGADAQTVGVDRLLDGCGDCTDCRAVAARSHPDLHLVYRQLNREHPDPAIRRRKALELGVDVLRHFVIDRAGLTAVRGRAKVFIIREADRATSAAQNALLKTLEEPPAGTHVVLLAATRDRLLPTTLSRCQVVRFDPLPTAFVRDKLGSLFPDMSAEQISWYASCSQGSLGATLEHVGDRLYQVNHTLVGKLTELNGRTIDSVLSAWTDASKTLGSGYRKRDPEISETEAVRRGFRTILQLAAAYYADILRSAAPTRSAERPSVENAAPAAPIAVSARAPAIINAAWEMHIRTAAQRTEAEHAVDAVNRIAQAEHQLDLNGNVQLVIETLAADLANLSAGVAVRAGVW